MADPVTASLAGVGIAGNALGAITQAIGSSYQGNAQAAMYNYQAGVARMNAAVAAQDANYAEAAGEVEAQQSGMRTGFEVAQTRAAFGASNIDVNTGSHVGVVGSEIAIGAQNQGIIRANAAKRAFGFEVQQAEDVAQAGAMQVAAQTARTTGQLGVASSIIGGAGGVSAKWLQAKQVGITSGGGDWFSGPGSGDYSGIGGWA